MVLAPPAVKVTVELFALNAAPLFVQFPPTLILEVFKINVPPFSVTSPKTLIGKLLSVVLDVPAFNVRFSLIDRPEELATLKIPEPLTTKFRYVQVEISIEAPELL